ncbi:DNA polymerase III subunit delta' [Shinella sp. CPCC 101442]|uniref:DNA polymerase III subunit delta' n=1 Tax=Shinella sp. CPCC 101442 TaxID=2932265 RepID=UPI002152AAE8|nr:DNA polymerase III subunit delta' [Shinella sp. CPCC 101442]MCR6501874.1 DNA polymerase III subunit delta' [Shinella sp. CPCC 101442]
MSDDRPGILDGAVHPAEQTKLFGHAEAQDFLARSYRSGKGHHAILIEGQEGIGKATLAFRFANHVLHHPEPAEAPEHIADPSPASPITRQLVAGASHNLLHLTRPVDEKSGKVKSAITVDEVRRAGKFLAQTSGTGNWRIVIIDPADDLNRNAANAILKILEEPPKRSLFLVLTHAPGKLLPTIRSRCLPLALAPLSEDELAAALDSLGATPSGPRAGDVLSAAHGSVSEALKLTNYGGFDIVEAFRTIVEAPAEPPRRDVHKLADVLSAKDSETVFSFFCQHATDFVTAAARSAALAGDISRADRLAQLSSQLGERIAIAQGYNLDRKQTIISVLDDIRASL